MPRFGLAIQRLPVTGETGQLTLINLAAAHDETLRVARAFQLAMSPEGIDPTLCAIEFSDLSLGVEWRSDGLNRGAHSPYGGRLHAATQSAGGVLRSALQLSPDLKQEVRPMPEGLHARYNGPIRGLLLPLHAWTALERANITTLDQLKAVANRLERLDGIGVKTARAIREELARVAAPKEQPSDQG